MLVIRMDHKNSLVTDNTCVRMCVSVNLVSSVLLCFVRNQYTNGNRITLNRHFLHVFCFTVLVVAFCLFCCPLQNSDATERNIFQVILYI